MSNFFHTARLALLALLFAGAANLAQAALYHVEFDTSAYTGTAYLDFLMTSGDPAAARSSASLSNFTGALGPLLEQDGDVSGTLGGGAVFGTAGAFNEVLQSVTLGGKFSFDIQFAGGFLTTPGDAGSTFSMALYDQLGYVGYQGNLVEFQLLPAYAGAPSGVLSTANGFASISAVPEPSVWLMVCAGLLVLAVMQRRRSSATMIYSKKL